MLHNLKAQTMTANAAAASVQIAAQPCEQFGTFLSLYEADKNLTAPKPVAAMPAPLAVNTLEIDPNLPVASNTPQESVDADTATDTDEEVSGLDGDDGDEHVPLDTE